MGPLESLSLLAKHLASVDNPCRENDRLQGPSDFGELRAEICRVTESTRRNNRVTLRKKLSASHVSLFKDQSTCRHMQHVKTTERPLLARTRLVWQMQTARGSAEHGDTCGHVPTAGKSPSDLPQPFSFLILCCRARPAESLFDHSI